MINYLSRGNAFGVVYRMMTCDKDGCFCWNGCDEALKESIRRSKYAQKVRKALLEKKYKKFCNITKDGM